MMMKRVMCCCGLSLVLGVVGLAISAAPTAVLLKEEMSRVYSGYHQARSATAEDCVLVALLLVLSLFLSRETAQQRSDGDLWQPLPSRLQDVDHQQEGQ